MKKNIVAGLLVVCGAIVTVSMSVVSDNGKAGFTGSPGENVCTNCHNSYTLNSGGGSLVISSSPAFVNNTYLPGTTYTMSATVSRTGNNLFGIGFEALTSTNTNSGTLAITNSAETRAVSVTVAGTSRKNVVHQLNGGASTNSKTFNFTWTAPSSGAVTFYAAGVAANANGLTSGDYVYNTSLALTDPMVGIQENHIELSALSLFPNPASNQIMLNYDLLNDAIVSVELLSMQGKLINLLLSEKQTAGKKLIQLPIPNEINSGCYLVRVIANGKYASKTIIIQ
jgi:hypothetical protein